jgi:hypothetical protein
MITAVWAFDRCLVTIKWANLRCQVDATLESFRYRLEEEFEIVNPTVTSPFGFYSPELEYFGLETNPFSLPDCTVD